MKNIFINGNTKHFQKIITEADIAAFESGTVHQVYATFSIARDAEWSGRLFVLDMKESHEEGIGTFIQVQHCAPAFVGETVNFIVTFEEISSIHEIITSFEAKVNNRLIATGKQGQKILPKEKLEKIFEKNKS